MHNQSTVLLLYISLSVWLRCWDVRIYYCNTCRARQELHLPWPATDQTYFLQPLINNSNLFLLFHYISCFVRIHINIRSWKSTCWTLGQLCSVLHTALLPLLKQRLGFDLLSSCLLLTPQKSTCWCFSRWSGRPGSTGITPGYTSV